ncbi:MAG: GGDEF domain-containing protein [Pseudomonadota bacterium]|nr:GGDEF domain-containing protein [Pseudomonadota bacterium]
MKLLSRPPLAWLLTIPYVVLVLGLAVTIAALSYQAASHAVDTVSDRLLSETVQRIGQAVERHVVGSGAVLEAAFPRGMAAPADIRGELAALRTRLWIATTLHRDPNNYAYYGNRLGQFAGVWRFSDRDAEWRVKVDADQPRTVYGFSGIDGDLRETRREAAHYDPRQRPWYLVGTRTALQAWTSVYVDFTTHELVATRARRVNGSDGQIEGVVATDLSLRALEDFVRELHVSEHGFAFIVEPNGDLVAASNSANVVRQSDGHYQRLNAGSVDNPLLLATFRELRGALSGPASQQPGVRRFTGPDGHQIEAGFARVTDSVGLDWTVVAAVPRADFIGGVTENVLRTIAVGVFAALIAVALGLVIVRSVTGDLRRLSVAAARVGDGDLESPIDIQRSDELGALAENFRLMQRKLRTDKLTGLANRDAVVQRLEARIRHRRRFVEPPAMAVLFVDIDDFKSVNDRFGHETGDRVLAELGARLVKGVRDTDLVARYAGDEFIVLLDGVASVDAADEVRQHLEHALQEPIEALPGGIRASVGGSIGLALYPRDGLEAHSVIAAADNDMYKRKSGRASSAT